MKKIIWPKAVHSLAGLFYHPFCFINICSSKCVCVCWHSVDYILYSKEGIWSDLATQSIKKATNTVHTQTNASSIGTKTQHKCTHTTQTHKSTDPPPTHTQSSLPASCLPMFSSSLEKRESPSSRPVCPTELPPLTDFRSASQTGWR